MSLNPCPLDSPKHRASKEAWGGDQAHWRPLCMAAKTLLAALPKTFHMTEGLARGQAGEQAALGLEAYGSSLGPVLSLMTPRQPWAGAETASWPLTLL